MITDDSKFKGNSALYTVSQSRRNTRTMTKFYVFYVYPWGPVRMVWTEEGLSKRWPSALDCTTIRAEDELDAYKIITERLRRQKEIWEQKNTTI